MWSSGSNLRFLIFYIFQNKYVILSCCKSLGGEKKRKMKKEFAIVAVIAVIMVSSAIAVTSMLDAQGNAQQYERNGITYFYNTIAIAQSTVSSSQVDAAEIKHDDGGIDLVSYFVGEDDPGHAVLFSPPKKPWTLDKVRIYGAYANISTLPVYYGVFTLEIWDNDYNLLYKLTDYSQAYFNTTFGWTEIDIPDININGDFYVCIFERASIDIGVDIDNPAMKSYVVQRGPNRMENAMYKEDATEKPLNWMIRAGGS